MMCGPALWGLGRLRDVYPIYIVRSYIDIVSRGGNRHAVYSIHRVPVRTSTGDTRTRYGAYGI